MHADRDNIISILSRKIENLPRLASESIETYEYAQDGWDI